MTDPDRAREVVTAWNRWHDTPRWTWETDRLITDEELADRITTALAAVREEARREERERVVEIVDRMVSRDYRHEVIAAIRGQEA